MSKVFYHANMFEGTRDEIDEDTWFKVDDKGRIEDSGTGDNYPESDEQYDLNHKYVMSGLINAHTHIMMNPYTNKTEFLTEAEVTVQALHNLEELLRSGQTYIRDCGCAFDVDIQLSQFKAAGKTYNYKMPDIVPSGRPMSMTGGHGDFKEGRDGKQVWGYLTDSSDEMRKAVRTAFKNGARNIKVMATGGVMSATDQVDDTELSFEELKTAVEEAHSKHMTVAAHAEGDRGIHNSVLAGVDSIEHGSYVTKEDIEEMKKRGTWLVTTLIAGWAIPEYGEGKIPDYMMEKAVGFLDSYFENIKNAVQGGVKIAFGTDAGTPFNGFKDAPFELELLVYRCGATNFQALQMAGKNSAQLLKIDQDYGTLEKGKFADFIVMNDNPLEDIKAIQQEDKGVYKKGQQMF